MAIRKIKSYSAFEIQNRIETLYDKGLISGATTGFESLDENITIKRGTTFTLFGQPGSGKTEFWLEVLVNLTERFGWKHMIYSPESGSSEDLAAEIISKKFRRPFHSTIPGHISESEMYHGIAWCQEYFRFVDPVESDATVEDFIFEINNQHDGFSPTTTMIDPWNELRHDLSTFGGRQDLYLDEKLSLLRRDAINHGRVNCVVTHVQDQQVQFKDGIRYYPEPTPREIAGGQSFHRKGMNMIGIWRPPFGLKDEDGIPYRDNEVHIKVHKYKPKGTGKRGKKIFFYDFKSNSYYADTNTGRVYSLRTEPDKRISGNTEAPRNNTESVSKDQLPF